MGERADPQRVRAGREGGADGRDGAAIGESGTARSCPRARIHDGSPRAARPFVKVNCAAIPEELIETELFGCVKGAYTGADRSREGKFQQADTGTIFLDEIAT